MKKPQFDSIWQDRDIRFDVDFNSAKLRTGEIEIERLEGVEDTKGNNGEAGIMKVTNLRLIWHAANMPRINLSVGHQCIAQVSTKKANSKLRGQTQALYILGKVQTSRYEFIFTSLNPHSVRLFTSVIAVHRAYETTGLYRELRMRAAIVFEDQLKLLPLEQQYNRIDGVWNLSSDQGNLGVFFITNVRLVWYAATNANFNVSIPYLQIRSSKVRESKFGWALVVETSQQSGGYVLGFRIDPHEKLHQTAAEIQSVAQTYAAKPIFGVQYVKEDLQPRTDQVTVEPVMEEVTIDASKGRTDAFAAYFADSTTGASASTEPQRGPIFCPELGLTIERPKEGFTIRDLWEINVD